MYNSHVQRFTIIARLTSQVLDLLLLLDIPSTVYHLVFGWYSVIFFVRNLFSYSNTSTEEGLARAFIPLNV